MAKRTSKRILNLSTPPSTSGEAIIHSPPSKKSISENDSLTSSLTTSVSTPMKGAWKEKTLSPKSGKVRFLQNKCTHYSFLKVRLEVSPHPDGATGVSKALGKLLEILQAADNKVQLAVYKGEISTPEKDSIKKVL